MDPRTAVVVEDEADIREVVAMVLRDAGFAVHTFASGSEAVAAVREHRPDVVTLDLGLPDMDGLEVAHQIRQFSDTYILMLTARAQEADAVLGLNSGADAYMNKPFRPRELRHRIEALMRRPRRGADAARTTGEAFPATRQQLLETGTAFASL